MKVRDLVESSTVEKYDSEKDLDIEIDIHKYNSLQECCHDTVDKIKYDDIFVDAEYNLMGLYKTEKGFTQRDISYAISCGYEDCWFLDDEGETAKEK